MYKKFLPIKKAVYQYETHLSSNSSSVKLNTENQHGFINWMSFHPYWISFHSRLIDMHANGMGQNCFFNVSTYIFIRLETPIPSKLVTEPGLPGLENSLEQ